MSITRPEVSQVKPMTCERRVANFFPKLTRKRENLQEEENTLRCSNFRYQLTESLTCNALPFTNKNPWRRRTVSVGVRWCQEDLKRI